MPKITINQQIVETDGGSTILEVCRRAGVHIPTLCHLEGHPAIGACRVCLVEVEGAKALVPSCATPVSDGMKIQTASRRVREARRTVVELLLSEHEGECQYCDRAEGCELRELAFDLGIREARFVGATNPIVIDASTPALVRDSGKCIKCRRCVTVCNEIQAVGALSPQRRGFATVIGPAFASTLDSVACVQCGQCAAVCPVGAITESSQIREVWEAIDDPKKHVVVQTAPAIRAALGECFDYPPGTLVTGKMVSALRELGFDAVFDTNFAADLTIMEEGTELLERLRSALDPRAGGGDGSAARDARSARASLGPKPGPNGGSAHGPSHSVALPQFTSCCPGWIKFAEYFHPELLPNLSTCKSPQQMFGAVAKTYYAANAGVKPEEVVVVSVMPCTAKKFEAGRPEMRASGMRDVDYVLTTRELGAMLKAAGIDFAHLPDGTMDSPLGISTGAADIFANTGGVMEAALRTVYEIVTGNPLPTKDLHVSPIEGLTGVKEAAILIAETTPEWAFLKGVELKVAVAHGLANAGKLIELMRQGKATYHFVEVMSCPGGCIGGGGQPRFTTDEVRLARIRAIYREDEGKPMRKSHENPDVDRIYRDFLGRPLGERSHELLHTTYERRARV